MKVADRQCVQSVFSPADSALPMTSKDCLQLRLILTLFEVSRILICDTRLGAYFTRLLLILDILELAKRNKVASICICCAFDLI
jgi:hypothetical protein